MRRLSILPFLILLLGVALPAHAAEPTLLRLANGMDVILLENHGAPMITSTIVVRAGVDYETTSSSGASHMMEHLLFNGTERRTQKELYDETDLYGIYNNAATRRFHSDYFVLAASDRIREAMDIQEDMIFHSTFPEKKFEKEKGIILEEIGKDEQSSSYLSDRIVRSILFAGTPYARPVLGTRQSVRDMSRADMLDYYRLMYIPNNMVLLVAGDFDTAEMIPMIRGIFGGAKPGGLPLPPAIEPPALPTGGRTHTFHMERNDAVLTVAFDAPGADDACSAFFRVLALFADIRVGAALAGGDSPVAIATDVSYERRARFGRLLVTVSFDPSRRPEQIEGAVVRCLNEIATNPPSPSELERFQATLKTEEIFLSEKLHHYGLMKAETCALGGYAAMEAFQNAIDSLRPEDFAAQRIDTEHRLSVLLLPGERDYPDGALDTVVPGEKPATERERVPYVEQPFALLRSGGEGERGPDRREERADTTLANGLRVVVISNDDSRVFALHLLARNRSLQEPEGREGIADLLHRLLLSGTEHADAAMQRAALERIGAEVKECDWSFIPFDDYYTVPAFSYLRFTTIDEYAMRGIGLFADMVLHPLLAEEDVESVKGEMLQLAGRRSARPSTLSRRLLAETLYGAHPLSADPEGCANDIFSITREEVSRFHRMYFAPDNLIVTAITSLPAKDVLRALVSKFSDAHALTRRKPEPADPEPTAENARVEEDLGGTQGYIRMGYTVRVPQKDRAALRVAISILSDRIAFDLRETRGLAYSIGAGIAFREETATITALIGTSPDNFAEAEDGIGEGFDRAEEMKDVDEREVERAVNSILGRTLMRRLSRPSQAFRLGLELLYGGRGTGDLRAVTPLDVTTAAGRYIRSSPMVTVLVR